MPEPGVSTWQERKPAEFEVDEAGVRPPRIYVTSILLAVICEALLCSLVGSAFHKPFRYYLNAGPGFSLLLLILSHWLLNVKPKFAAILYLIFTIPILLVHVVLGLLLLSFRAQLFTPPIIDRNLVFDNTLVQGCFYLFVVPWICVYAAGLYRVYRGHTPEAVGLTPFAELACCPAHKSRRRKCDSTPV